MHVLGANTSVVGCDTEHVSGVGGAGVGEGVAGAGVAPVGEPVVGLAVTVGAAVVVPRLPELVEVHPKVLAAGHVMLPE